MKVVSKNGLQNGIVLSITHFLVMKSFSVVVRKCKFC